MASYLPDNIDFAHYLDQTECEANIRSAGEFVDDLIALIEHKPGVTRGRLLPWANTHQRIEFRPHEVTIWTGINGHGKSLVLGQTILSLIAQGAKCCIASFEMTPARTLFRMARQAATTHPDKEFGRLFADYTTGKLWLHDHHGAIESKAVCGAIRYASDKLGITHFVVDSLMKCGIAEDGPGAMTAQKHFVDQLCTIAHDTGVHIHLVAHSRKGESEYELPGKFDVAGSAMLTNQVDNVLAVWRNKRKEEAGDPASRRMRKGESVEDIADEPDALLCCSKQRNGDWEGKVRLWFDPESTQFLTERGGDPMNLMAGYMARARF